MATVAFSLAIGLGGMLIQKLFAPKPKDIYGPRLSDLNVPSVSPGTPIPRHWGTMKIPATMIWCSELIENEVVIQGGSSKAGSAPNQINYTYSRHGAWAVCEGPVVQWNRIWADQKLLWVNPQLAAEEGQSFDQAYYAELDRLYNQEGDLDVASDYVNAFFFAYNQYDPFNTLNQLALYFPAIFTETWAQLYINTHPGTPVGVPSPTPSQEVSINNMVLEMFGGMQANATCGGLKVRYAAITFYNGDELQNPDPTMESVLNPGNVPAYRGTAYFVIQDLQLQDFGNTTPTLAVEVVKSDGNTYLHQILVDCCKESQLDEDEFQQFGTLPVITIPGFALTQAHSGRTAFQELQKVYPFDAIESGWTMKFNWINQRACMAVDRDDLAAHADGENAPDSDQMTRAHDWDLPVRMNLKFQEPVRNYSMNHVFALREVPQSNTVIDEEVTIAITRQDAKTYVEEQMSLRFAARVTWKRTLPRKYAMLEPGDVILLPDKGDETLDPVFWRESRILQKSVGANGVIEFQFMDPCFHQVVQAVTETDLVTFTPASQPGQSVTFSYMLDCPILLDTDPDNVGFYAVITGTNGAWTGGALYADLNSAAAINYFGESTAVPSPGTNYFQLATGQTQVANGFVQVLPLANKHEMCWDWESVVQVWMYNPTLQLTSITQQQAYLNPYNLCMLGSEIIQFLTATSLGNGVWQLSGLLRGLRGTEGSIANHALAEQFVMLVPGTIARISHAATQIGASYSYKAVSNGQDISLPTAFNFANSGNSLRPYAPQIWQAYKDLSNNRYLVWNPRSRRFGGWADGATVVLDQPSEVYNIDVYQGGTKKQSYSFTSTRSWTYTTSMMTTDGVTATSAIQFNLYEIGATIGADYVTTVTI
jgi:hypothetical protein